MTSRSIRLTGLRFRIGAAGAVLFAAVLVLSGCSTPSTENRDVAAAPETTTTVGTAAAPQRSPAEALDAGVAFLLAQQNDDGSWGHFHSTRPYEVYLDNLSSHRAFRMATTALCVQALYGVSRENEDAFEAVRRGLEYLLTAEQPGRASGSTFYNTWAHTYALEALAILARDDRFADRRDDITRVAEREIETLCGLQSSAGGWGYYDFSAQLKQPTGAQTTSFNTAATLIAFYEARQSELYVGNDVVESALACVERLRLPSGAFIYGFGHRYLQTAEFNQVKGSLGRSQPCNLALWLFERNMTVDDLRRGLENLRKFHYIIEIGRGRQFPHEAWYATAGYYYYFGHYYASRVIGEMPEDDDHSRAEFAEWLAGVMAATQNPDGSWFDFPFYGYSQLYGGAFGVMTLNNCLRAMESE